MSTEILSAEVLKMSFIERLTFIQFIVDSIKEETLDNQVELSEKWKKELDRRSELYHSGKAETFPWEEVKAGMEAKFVNL